MALLRRPEYCFKCGKRMIEKHRDQSHIPSMMRNIGDNFIGYEHDGPCDGETEEYKKLQSEIRKLPPITMEDLVPKYRRKQKINYMSVKAKFTCNSIVDGSYGGKAIHFNAVYGTGEENKSWSAATPSGSLMMMVTNPSAAEFFKQGKDYFLTFEEA